MFLRSGKHLKMDKGKRQKESNVNDRGEGSQQEKENSDTQDRIEQIETVTEQGDSETPAASQQIDIQQFMQQMFLKLDDKLDKNHTDINNKLENNNRDLIESIDNKIENIHEVININNRDIRNEMENMKIQLNDKLDQIELKIEERILEKVNAQIENKMSETISQVQDNLELIGEENVKKLDDMQSKLEKEINKMRGEMKKVESGNQIQNIYQIGQEEKLIFNGDKKIHPMVFIRELSQDCEGIEGNNIKKFIRNRLKGDAELWYSLIEERYENFDQFEKLFIENYWGQEYQNKIRMQLINGKYDPNGYYLREKYILKKFSYARHLQPKLQENELVSYLANHFNDNIRDVILIQQIDTIERLIQYLRRLDGRNNFNRREDGQARKNEQTEDGQNRNMNYDRRNWNNYGNRKFYNNNYRNNNDKREYGGEKKRFDEGRNNNYNGNRNTNGNYQARNNGQRTNDQDNNDKRGYKENETRNENVNKRTNYIEKEQESKSMKKTNDYEEYGRKGETEERRNKRQDYDKITTAIVESESQHKNF